LSGVPGALCYMNRLADHHRQYSAVLLILGIKKALSHFRLEQLATASREKTGQVRLVLDKRVGDAVTFALAIGVVRSA
jgi:hypothetical protein